jgi:hypothetical protein
MILHGIWVKYGGNPNKCNKYIYTDRGFIVMVDALWRLFEKTGSVGSYLLYKAVQRVEGESYLDPSVSSSGEEKKVYQVGKE